MSLFNRLFGSPPPLDPSQRARLDQWRSLPTPSTAAPVAQSRLVVVDLESTGLDPYADLPLSIGAVAVEGGRARLDQLFLRLLRQSDTGKQDAVLIHGISPSMRERGSEPAEALLDFLIYSARAPLVAYHAPFDQTLLERETRRRLGLRFKCPWLDLAWLLPALFPEARLVRAPLDAWIAHFRLAVPERHRAEVDALMTAELLLIALKRAAGRGMENFRDLSALAKAEARLQPTHGSGGF